MKLFAFVLIIPVSSAFHARVAVKSRSLVRPSMARDLVTLGSKNDKSPDELEQLDGYVPKVDWDADFAKLKSGKGQVGHAISFLR